MSCSMSMRKVQACDLKVESTIRDRVCSRTVLLPGQIQHDYPKAIRLYKLSDTTMDTVAVHLNGISLSENFSSSRCSVSHCG